jgi:hypothetical protein
VLRRVVHELDADCLDARDALDMLRLFAEVERLGNAGKTLVARRVFESRIWKHEGYRSAAELVAAASGTSVGQARQVIDTSRRLSELSRTEDDLRAARLSQAQAHEVTRSAAAAPERERELLDCAQSDGLAGLKQRGAKVRADAMTEDEREERHERARRARSLRHWTDADGLGHGEWRLPVDAHARLVACVRAEQDRIFRARRASGEREDPQAYAADALVNLVDHRCDTTTAKRANTVVMLRVELEKLQRHGTDAEGICEIAGVGPVPVSVAREALGNDAMVKLVITKGVDVINVAHLGRTKIAAVQTALDWLYDECGVVGCHRRVNIEDHHTEPFRETGHTAYRELAPLCSFDHDLVEHKGYQLRKRPDGEWDLVPPDHADRAPP